MDPAPAWLHDLLAAGRHRALLERARLADDGDDDALAARAALAWLGLGPAHELVAVARAAKAAAWPAADELARRAARLLARLGDLATARALVGELGPSVDDAALVRLAAARPVRDPAGALDAALEAAADGADNLVADPARPARLRWWALDRRLAAATADGDVARARALAEQATQIAPDGDDGDRHRMRAAAWAWRDGDAVAAVAAVRRVAAALRAEKPTPAGRVLLADAEAVLAAIDRPGAAVAWQPALAPAAPVDAPTAAHQVRALAGQGATPVRVTVTPASAAAVLAAGGALWLELAGPRRLAEVRGVDATTGASVLVDRGRARLVWWQVLERASGPFGLGGIAAWPAGVAPAVDGDARLAALDACDLDEDGQAPPRGFVFHTARTALAAHPTWARALWRWGEELGAAHAGGHVAADDVVRWYAQAREHVAHAAWTFAGYARLLAAQGRRQEAAMASRDALLRAPEDVEIAIGCGEAMHAAGRAGSALAVLSMALAAAPLHAVGLATAAEALLVLDAGPRAQAAAELALARDPGAAAAGQVLVSCLERADQPGAARAALGRLRAAAPEHGGLALRAAIVAARAGAWDEARAAAGALIERVRNPGTIALGARLAWCGGARAPAWAAIADGVRAHGHDDTLLAQAATFLAAMTGADAAAALAEVTAGLGPGELSSWAYALSEQELHPLAIATADRALALGPEHGNSHWHAARCRLRAGDGDRARVRAGLEHVVAVAPGFPLARFALGLVAVDDDPPAALVAVAPGLHDLAALGWVIEAQAAASLGRADDAAALERRLVEAATSLGPATLVAARLVGAPAVAARLGEVALAAGASSTGMRAELATALVALDRLDEAAAVLAPLAERVDDGPDHLIVLAALAAGAPRTAAAAAARARALLRDSRRWDLDDAMDPWWYLAAAAAAAEDDDEAAGHRDQLARGAPAHPSAWAVVARGRRGAPGPAEARARVETLAPGLAVALAGGGR